MNISNHIKPFALKLLIVTTIILSVQTIAIGASLFNLIVISLIVTTIAYFVGDLYILPRAGNAMASILDFGLSFLMLWVLGLLFFTDRNNSIVVASLFTAMFIALSEPLFHAYLKNKLFTKDDERKRNFTPNYSVEAAEEEDLSKVHQRPSQTEEE